MGTNVKVPQHIYDPVLDLRRDRPTPLGRELEKRAAEMNKTLVQYVEELAAAYYAKTNIPPEEAVIVYDQRALDGCLHIYIRRRERDGA